MTVRGHVCSRPSLDAYFMQNRIWRCRDCGQWWRAEKVNDVFTDGAALVWRRFDDRPRITG